LIRPIFTFTIFMITLGPIKTIPGFFLLTKDLDAKPARTLAIKAALIATAVALFIAFGVHETAAAWGISIDGLRITGGLLLFAAARDMISHFNELGAAPASLGPNPAVTPLAIPLIVTPWGVVAILIFTEIARDDLYETAVVIGMLLFMMALNLIGMLLARPIMRLVGVGAFQVLGWIFAVLQASLAIEAILVSLRNLGILPPA
jgi:small neutral amino acid transporter SnatA (MarC family)